MAETVVDPALVEAVAARVLTASRAAAAVRAGQARLSPRGASGGCAVLEQAVADLLTAWHWGAGVLADDLERLSVLLQAASATYDSAETAVRDAFPPGVVGVVDAVGAR